MESVTYSNNTGYQDLPRILFREQQQQNAKEFASHFGKPPAEADEEKTPVLKELGRLALNGVADELEDPADDEKADGEHPEAGMPEDEWDHQDAERDHGDADGVTDAIDRVLVAVGVLADPIIPASVSEHDAPPGCNLVHGGSRVPVVNRRRGLAPRRRVRSDLTLAGWPTAGREIRRWA
jgi:hypothetical protein